MEDHVPPPGSTPPVINLASRQKPSSSRRGWIWGLLGLALLGVLMLLVLSQVLRTFHGVNLAGKDGRQPSRPLHEVVVEQHHSRNKIVLVDVDGIITSSSWDRSGRNMVESIQDQLRAAALDDAVKAVILKVDSPGGEVLASDDIARAVRDFQEETQRPVIASMGSVAASGGYYVSAPCQWIVANELTITGSIGVIMQSLNYRGLLDKVGVRPEVFKSGKFKDMLSGSRPPGEIDPKEREMLQSMINETFQKFTEVVATGRARAAKENAGTGRELAANWKEFADGRVLTGKQALELGFVDELGSFDTALERARKLASLEDANVIRFAEPFNMSQLFSVFGQSESRGMKIDLGLEFPRLQAGRPYFLSPTLVH